MRSIHINVSPTIIFEGHATLRALCTAHGESPSDTQTHRGASSHWWTEKVTENYVQIQTYLLCRVRFGGNCNLVCNTRSPGEGQEYIVLC